MGALARLVIAAALLALTGCARSTLYAPHPCDRPDMTGCLVSNVSIAGASKVPAAAIKGKIATNESSHAFGGALEGVPILSVWDRITVDYERFDPFVLERDLARVERLYRAQGYYEAHARAARVRKVDGKARVEIVVDEGQPVNVGRVHMAYKDGEPSARAKSAIARVEHSLKRGKPFVEDDFEAAKKEIARALTDAGYAYATVEGTAKVDLARHEAFVRFDADVGPLCKFGPITIEGNVDLPKDKLLQTIAIKEGDRYSTAKIDSAQIELGDLRVLGAVDAIPTLSPPGAPRSDVVPLVFHVTPTPLKTVKMGGGAELGYRVEVHGLAGWENRNFLGGLRHFTIEARPIIELYPLQFPQQLAPPPGESIRPLPEMRLHSELVQPGFLEARTNGVLDLDISVYRPITSDALIGYFELAGKAGIRRGFWNGRILLAGSVNMQFDRPFPYTSGTNLEAANGGFRTVTLPSVQASVGLDFRRGYDGKLHPIDPHSGIYFSTDSQVAFLDSYDVRLRPDFRAYIPVSKRVTLALRVGGGLLVPISGALKDPLYYPGLCTGNLGDPPSCAEYLRQLELLQFRGFFSGGTNDNRGYAYNAVGPQAIVPALSSQSTAPIATGGSALWQASLELRFPIVDKFRGTWFVDASDVAQSLALLTLRAPHVSTGLGFRYETPVGPVRVDFGVRIPGLQVLGDTRPVFDPARAPTEGSAAFLPKSVGQAGSIFGVPLALALAIGEAF